MEALSSKIPLTMALTNIKTRSSMITNILCFLVALFFILLLFLPLSNYSINFPTPISVFIIGNLIVVVLIGESKVFASKSSDFFADNLCFYDGTLIVGGDENRGLKICHDDDEWEMGLENCEDLSKRADDFIARVNMQREIEASILCFCCELKTTKNKYRKKALKCLTNRVNG
ncbi:hypothetical protein SDJN03_27028, partial [Cucurbita argyrosperma subsp. sororia]